MSVNSTVASTRSSATSAWWPVRNSAISWKDARHGSTKWYMLRPGSSTYFAPGMWSATYLPCSGGIIGSSAWWTTRVGTRIVGSTARTSISATRGIMRATVPGLAARRSSPSPRCPDLLVPRHVRIHDMLHLPRAPHGDHGGDDFLGSGPSVRSAIGSA